MLVKPVNLTSEQMLD